MQGIQNSNEFYDPDNVLEDDAPVVAAMAATIETRTAQQLEILKTDQRFRKALDTMIAPLIRAQVKQAMNNTPTAKRMLDWIKTEYRVNFYDPSDELMQMAKKDNETIHQFWERMCLANMAATGSNTWPTRRVLMLFLNKLDEKVSNHVLYRSNVAKYRRALTEEATEPDNKQIKEILFNLSDIEKELNSKKTEAVNMVKENNEGTMKPFMKGTIPKCKNAKCNGARHWWSNCDHTQCRKCNRFGHIAKYCKNLSANKAETSSSYISLSVVEGKEDLEKWIFDSGATTHITYDEKLMQHLNTSVNIQVSLADGRLIQVDGVGTVELRDDMGHKFLLENVLLIKDLKRNLLSVPRLATNYDVNISKQEIQVKHRNDGKVMLSGKLSSQNLYCLRQTSIKHEALSAVASFLWHNRLGHKSLEYLKKTLTAYGLPSNIELPEACHACFEGKGRQHTFKQRTSLQASEPLERLHMDLAVNWSPESVHGYKHVLVIVDEYSRNTWTFPLMNKSGTVVATTLRHWITMMENLVSKKVKIMQSDNGTEFLNEEIRKIFLEKGIKQITSCADHPEQNGIAERRIGLLKEMIRTMLNHSKLPHSLWTEALEHATYVMNATYSSSIDGIPHQKLFGTLPDINHLKVFGCLAHLHKRDTILSSGTFAPKTVQAIYLGPAKNKKGHLFFAPIINRWIETMHATFDEKRFLSLPANPSFPPHNGRSSTPKFAGVGCNEIPVIHNFQIASDRAIPISTENIAEVVSSDSEDEDFVEALEEIIETPQRRASPVPELPAADNPDKSNDSASKEAAADNSLTSILVNRNPETDISETEDFATEDLATETMATSKPVVESKAISTATNIPDTSELRRSSRQRKPIGKYDPSDPSTYNTAPLRQIEDALAVQQVNTDKLLSQLKAPEHPPRSFKEAIESDHSAYWSEAMNQEFLKLVKFDVFIWAKKPKDRNTLKSLWHYTIKRDKNDRISEFKARFCAKGFSQKYGEDFIELFAPALRPETLRILFTFAALRDLDIHQMDVSSAFLHADIDAEVYVEAPKGFEHYDETRSPMVMKLNKALYGLKQAPRLWSGHVQDKLKSNNFIQSVYDSCLFTLTENGDTVYLLHHVDDFLLFGKGELLVKAKNALLKAFTMKDLGHAEKFLNVQIIRDRARKTITLSQKHYVNEILSKFGMKDAKPLATPLPSLEIPSYDPEEDFHSDSYLAMLGSLNYLCSWTRPDLSFAVSKMSQFMMKHNKGHYDLLRNVFRYLAGTRDHSLVLGGIQAQSYQQKKKLVRATYAAVAKRNIPTTDTKAVSKVAEELSQEKLENGLSLIAYSDADYAGDIDDRRSRTGSAVLLSNSLVAWQSKKQTVVTTSTAESEYIALASTAQLAEWMSNLLDEIQGFSPSPIHIYEDNQACLKLANNTIELRKIRHVQVKQHFVRQRVAVGAITLEYCPSADNIADIFTKSLPKALLEKFRTEMRIMGTSNVNKNDVLTSTIKHSRFEDQGSFRSRGSVTSDTLESANYVATLLPSIKSWLSNHNTQSASDNSRQSIATTLP